MQIDSYNEFVNDRLRDMIHNQVIRIHNGVHVILIRFMNVYTGYPTTVDTHLNREKPLFPHDARLEDLSYETNVSCDIEIVVLSPEDSRIIHHTLYPKTLLFTIPVMVLSLIHI